MTTTMVEPVESIPIPELPVDLLEHREITYFTGFDEKPTDTTSFPVLVINTPEKWKEAETFHASYRMPIAGGFQAFPLHGVSLKDWSDANYAVTIPEWEGAEGTEDAGFILSKQQAILHKQVLVFEKSFGQIIPGDKPEDKIQFLAKRATGELEAIYTFIQHQMCNWEDASDLLPKYMAVANRSTLNKTKEVISFLDWKEATEASYFFRMQRRGETFLCEFPLKAISQEQKTRIDQECILPEPPPMPIFKREERERTGQNTRPNRQDPKWLATVRSINEKRTILYFNACLPFTIPGENEKEQYDWVAKRLVGDVDQLKTYIETELLSYGSRFQYFINGQDQVA